MQKYYSYNRRSNFLTPEMVKSAGKGQFFSSLWRRIKSFPGRFNPGQAGQSRKNFINAVSVGVPTAGLAGLLGHSIGSSSGFDEGSRAGFTTGLQTGANAVGKFMGARNSGFLDRLGNLFTGSATAMPNIQMSPQQVEEALKMIREKYY